MAIRRSIVEKTKLITGEKPTTADLGDCIAQSSCKLMHFNCYDISLLSFLFFFSFKISSNKKT